MVGENVSWIVHVPPGVDRTAFWQPFVPTPNPALGVPNTGLSSATGMLSVRVTLLTVLGPSLWTTMV